MSQKEVESVSESDVDGQEGGSFSYAVQRLPAGISIVRATGDLNAETRSLVYQIVADEVAREPAQLVLELSGVTSLDDAGVEVLLSASALAGDSDISFCLVTSHAGPVVSALGEANVIERFEIFATVDEAKRHR